MHGGADHSIRIVGPQERDFACRKGDSLLAGALRAGIGFPYECNSGGCGSCQFELVEGEVSDLWPEAPGISERQRGRGRRLACQSAPLGDCTVKVSLNDDLVPAVRPDRHTLTYAGSRALTADMAEFTFHTDGPADFLPGQFAMLDLPGVEGPRAYSMSNLANNAGEWRFIVKRVPDGAGTAFLFDKLAPGDTVRLDGPFGNAWLRTDAPRDIACVAGGSGLSPVLSILQGIAAAPELEGRRVALFHGIRGPQDDCIEDALAEHPGLRERVELFRAISDEQAPGADAWTGDRGFIHEIVRRELGEAMAAHEFYFCGPPAMTDAVHRMLLLEARVPAGQLHFDRFY